MTCVDFFAGESSGCFTLGCNPGVAQSHFLGAGANSLQNGSEGGGEARSYQGAEESGAGEGWVLSPPERVLSKRLGP